MTATMERLNALPRSERNDALQSLVVAELKSALLMTDRDELPVDANYFDLGLSSLRAVEVKQRLETELGRPIDTALVFSSPTVETLVAHLTAEGETESSNAAMRPLVDALLEQLYQS